MFGQRLVNRRAVSVTQGESGSARGEAFPKKLDHPEFLFGRQLEEFGNVGITHGAYPTTVGGGSLTTDASAECYLICRGATKPLEYTSGLPSSQGWYVLANLIRSASEG